MAVVNICRPAWKGPRVTRRTTSLSLFLSSAFPTIVSPFSHFARCHWTNFRLGVPAFSLPLPFFPLLSAASHECRSKTNYSSRSDAAPSKVQQRKRIGKREEDRTTTLENGTNHAMDAYHIRSACFLSFFRPERPRSRSQDATVSGVRQLSLTLPLDEINNIDEDVSTPSLYSRISRLRPESVSRKRLRACK